MARGSHIHAHGGEASGKRGLQHIAGEPRILADEDAMAVIAARKWAPPAIASSRAVAAVTGSTIGGPAKASVPKSLRSLMVATDIPLLALRSGYRACQTAMPDGSAPRRGREGSGTPVKPGQRCGQRAAQPLLRCAGAEPADQALARHAQQHGHAELVQQSPDRPAAPYCGGRLAEADAGIDCDPRAAGCRPPCRPRTRPAR